MIGLQFPNQGLQPFTKKFGQSLHESDDEKTIETKVIHENIQQDLSDQNFPIVIDKPADLIDDSDEEVQTVSHGIIHLKESLQDFNYDSDGDESISSTIEDAGEEVIVEVDNKTFLLEHSDILPNDAPIETIDTLKALKYHIESSENRSFTNLERQLLATIVQHGIFNAKNDQEESKEKQTEKNLQTPDINHDEVEKSIEIKDACVSDTQQSSGTDHIKNNKTDQVHDKNMEESLSQISDSSEDSNIAENQKNVHPEACEYELPNKNVSSNSESSATRKILLPTPGSFEEVTNVLIDNGAPKNFSRPTLSIEEQIKLTKAIKALPISEKLKKIQNSCHPDDEPTFELFESMNKSNDKEPAYEDLLNTFSNQKQDKEAKPKYRSKTKILPPRNEFSKRQRQLGKDQRDSPNPNRRVVKRDSDEKTYTIKNTKDPVKRKVKVQYKEVSNKKEIETGSCINNLPSKLDKDHSRKRKKQDTLNDVDGIEYRSDDESKERAVDILTNLITQKFLDKISKADGNLLSAELGLANNMDESMIISNNQHSQISTPQNPSSHFQPQAYIATSLNHNIINPVPIPIAPLMSHPGLILSSIDSDKSSKSKPDFLSNKTQNNVIVSEMDLNTNLDLRSCKTNDSSILIKEPFPKFPNTVDYIDLCDPKKDNSNSASFPKQTSTGLDMITEEGEIC